MLYPVLQDPLRPVVGSLFDRPVGVNIRQMLFGAGEQGGWYDVADMSTLFQDSAGATPVTAVEQQVGRMLDKSGRGNHATQVTATKRPVYSRRVNLLTKTDSLSNLAWSTAGVSVSGNRVTASSTNAIHILYQVFPYVPNQSVCYRIQVAKKVGFGFFQLCYSNVQRIKCTLNLDTGEYEVSSIGGASAVVTVTDTGTGRFEVTITGTNAAAIVPGYFNCGLTTALSGVPTNPYDEPTFMGNGEYMDLYEPDIRLAIDAHLPYQWVNTATDYDADPSKFPAYLRFDGVDDALQTANIDFTGTDKMTVWAGVTKLSDAATSIFLESSNDTNSNHGAFYITAPEQPGASSFAFKSRGSLDLNPVDLYGNAAPISRVVAAIGDIGGDIATIRAGGASVTGTEDQGAGNHGNYPLYIGARAGTSLYFNGRLYSLIVRGAQTPLSQIQTVESYIKQKMRLP